MNRRKYCSNNLLIDNSEFAYGADCYHFTWGIIGSFFWLKKQFRCRDPPTINLDFKNLN